MTMAKRAEGLSTNPKLTEMLRKRGVRIGQLCLMIQGGCGRTSVALTLSGVRPLKREADAGLERRPLSKTWRGLRQILSAEEFACALEFANRRRAAAGLVLVADSNHGHDGACPSSNHGHDGACPSNGRDTAP